MPDVLALLHRIKCLTLESASAAALCRTVPLFFELVDFVWSCNDCLARRQEPVSGCEHRKFKLLFVLEKPGEWKPGRGVLSELSAVNARLFAFARQMAKRGHRVQVADPERFSQVRVAWAVPQLLGHSIVTPVISIGACKHCCTSGKRNIAQQTQRLTPLLLGMNGKRRLQV